MPLLIVQVPEVPDDIPLSDAGAYGADRCLIRVRCDDADAISAVLRALAAVTDTPLVLIEPGALRPHLSAPQALRRGLDALPVPYIELHADTAEELDSLLHPQQAHIAIVVTPHDRDRARARAYTMSLAIAAHRLTPAGGH